MDLMLIETHVFTREIKELLPDNEHRMLQWELVLRPESGDLIPGGGGLRKIRWKIAGNTQEDLTPKQLKVLKTLVKENFK